MPRFEVVTTRHIIRCWGPGESELKLDIGKIPVMGSFWREGEQALIKITYEKIGDKHTEMHSDD